MAPSTPLTTPSGATDSARPTRRMTTPFGNRTSVRAPEAARREHRQRTPPCRSHRPWRWGCSRSLRRWHFAADGKRWLIEGSGNANDQHLPPVGNAVAIGFLDFWSTLGKHDSPLQKSLFLTHALGRHPGKR